VLITAPLLNARDSCNELNADIVYIVLCNICDLESILIICVYNYRMTEQVLEAVSFRFDGHLI
jgi:hypothetical protein